jgi:hypothetical protein
LELVPVAPGAGLALMALPALTEVSARRPELDSGSAPVKELRAYLNGRWITSQIDYQRKTSARQGTFDDRLVRATELLFLLTLVAAGVHIFASLIFPAKETGGESPGVWKELLVVVSITVRYLRMAGVLAQVEAEMADWFGVMRFHDMELIT